jgi:hypothetical protein
MTESGKTTKHSDFATYRGDLAAISVRLPLQPLIGAVESHRYASEEEKRHQVLRDEARDREWQSQGAMPASEVINDCGEKRPQKAAANIRTGLRLSSART